MKSCPIGSRRFTVLRVNGNPSDTHAAPSFEEALDLANPDRNSHVEVFVVCAPDSGAARLPSVYERFGRRVKTFRYKRGG